MTSSQRAAAAEAVLNFLEHSDALNASDELRIVLEVKNRGRPVRRMRYAINRGRVRTFVRTFTAAAKQT